MSGPLIAWVIEALLASTLLMAAVLLARAPVRRWFGPQVAYALWALPALRLVLPPMPADWREQVAMPISRASEVVFVLPDTPVPDAPSDLPWLAIGLAAWALGAAAFFAMHLLRHRRFCRDLLADARVVDDIDGVRVIETEGAGGPLAFGMLRRYVAFPPDFADRYDADERELALLHELGHHQRRDLWANWAALGVLALHWFNPLAWRAFRAFRCDQELANDARVLAGRGRADRHIYACAIVKAAHGGHVSAACHLHTIDDLKGRLRMLTRARPSRRRVAAGTSLVTTLVVSSLWLTASGTRAAAAVTEKIGDAVGVDLAAQATAATPEAPPATPIPVAPRKNGKGAHDRVTVRENGVTHVYVGDEARAYMAAHPAPTPPTPPAAPVAFSAPDAPAAPPAPGATPFRVESRSDGTWRISRVDGAPIPPAPPAVSRRDCVDGEDGGPRQLVLQRTQGGERVMIVCQNRIDRAARDGARMGKDYARDARLQAMLARQAARNGRIDSLAGIQAGRSAIAANRSLTDEQRREALAGLAEAEADLHEAGN